MGGGLASPAMNSRSNPRTKWARAGARLLAALLVAGAIVIPVAEATADGPGQGTTAAPRAAEKPRPKESLAAGKRLPPLRGQTEEEHRRVAAVTAADAAGTSTPASSVVPSAPQQIEPESAQA